MANRRIHKGSFIRPSSDQPAVTSQFLAITAASLLLAGAATWFGWSFRERALRARTHDRLR